MDMADANNMSIHAGTRHSGRVITVTGPVQSPPLSTVFIFTMIILKSSFTITIDVSAVLENE